MIIDISVAIIAAAVVVLVIALIYFIRAFCRTLSQVNRALIEARKQLEDGGNAAKVIEHANQLSYDLKKKMEALDPIFNAFSNVGDFLEQKTFFLKRGTSRPEKKIANIEVIEPEEKPSSSDSIKVGEVFDFVDKGLSIWQKMMKRRKQ